MTFAGFSVEDIAAVRAGRDALIRQRDFGNGLLLDEFLSRMRAARDDEIAAAVVEELTERRGLLRVVD